MSEGFGIKISKSGQDVMSCGYDDLIFTSEFPLLKVHKQGSGTLTIDETGTGTVAISHSTGITPMFMAFTEYYQAGLKQTGYKQFSFGFFTVGDIYEVYKAWTDSSNLNIACYFSDMGEFDLKYFYFIFEDPILDV